MMADAPAKVAPGDAWAALNDRQRLYLKEIYEADQSAEASAKASRYSPPASEWRWVLYSINAPKDLVGRSTIQWHVERAGKLDTGAGSSLAALKRRGLVEVWHTWIELPLLGPTPCVKVKMTQAGRAAVRAGLGIAPPTRIPTGLLTKAYLWDAMAWLYEAGEQGFTTPYSRSSMPAEQKRFRPSWNTLLALRDRREGEFWENPPKTFNEEYRYRLSAIGREHYVRHWACYADLFPEVEAPEPEASPDAHTALADHFAPKPKGLLPGPQWRLLAELVMVHRSGDCPLKRIIRYEAKNFSMPEPDLSEMPDGLLPWYIAHYVTSSKTAAAKLVERKAGALAQYTDVRPWSRGDTWQEDSTPLMQLHVTEAGLAHFDERLAEYQKHYPEVKVKSPVSGTYPALGGG
jgi:hypothetical protein